MQVIGNDPQVWPHGELWKLKALIETAHKNSGGEHMLVISNFDFIGELDVPPGVKTVLFQPPAHSGKAGLPPPTSIDNPAKRFLRRQDAGRYLKERYGFGSARSLAKLAVYGEGPLFRKAGAAVLYELDELDRWALAQIGGLRRSTRDEEAA